MKTLRHLVVASALCLALTGCTGFTYNAYQGDLAPAALQPYDLADNAPAAPVIYFDTYTAREAGIAVHRLLLATHVDGQLLPGAAETPAARGYQALRLTPGRHSLSWCWLSKNSWGPGSERCGLQAKAVQFEAGQHYLVKWSDAKAFSGPVTFVQINTQIENLDSHTVIFRQDAQ